MATQSFSQLHLFESSGVPRHSDGLSILARAFPSKLKYVALSSANSRHILSTGHNVFGVAGKSVIRPAEGAIGKGEILVEAEAEELGRGGAKSVGRRNMVQKKGTGANSPPARGNRFASKRMRGGESSGGSHAVDNRRTNRSLIGSLNSDGKDSFTKKKSYNNLDDYTVNVESNLENEADGGEAKKSFSSDISNNVASSNGGPRSTATENESYLSDTRFEQFSVSPLSLKGINAAGYERMTIVQEATLPVILEGKDVLAKAKTGTGKTIAFLLPAVEVVCNLPQIDFAHKRPSINVLVLCPTRELAVQAATEAQKLLKYHHSIGVQVVIGGTRLTQEQRSMQANPCQILIATPGRLKDHIENTTGFASRLKGVKVLVLDEADRLLDMGFRKDIEKIVSAVPKQRQTLLFSATVPDEVREICHIAMKKDYKFISTVEEGSEETHSQVRQTYLVAPLAKHLSILCYSLREHIAEDADYKVIIFCTTAMVTKLVADILTKLQLNVREIHSRKSQSFRSKVSEEFRLSKGLILVSSDVSARGVDYPDVTLVIQVGLPADREQYIHRLGRTGRKGKVGEGILLLAPWEKFFLTRIKDLPVAEAPLPIIDEKITKEIEEVLQHVEMKNKESAYQAWLGYYNSDKSIGKDKARLVELANEFSQSLGLRDPPAIPKLILRKMGLANVPGLLSK